VQAEVGPFMDISKAISDEKYPIQLRIFWVMKQEIEKTAQKTKDKKLLKEWLENIKLVSEIIGGNPFAMSPKHNLDFYLKDKISELEEPKTHKKS
jgi:hypothetical protein